MRHSLYSILLLLLLTTCTSPTAPGKITMYGADWCPPCHIARPKLEHLAFDLNYDFEYVNVDHWRLTNYYTPYIPRVLIETTRGGSLQIYYFGYPSDQIILETKFILGEGEKK